MNNNGILLVFKDEQDLRVLKGYLSGIGFELTVARDGAEALESALTDPPCLIIADMELPLVDGERLFRIVRRTPHTSRVPFFFVSEDLSYMEGFRTGLDTFLSRPFDMHVIDGRIRQALSRADIPGANKVMEGRLTHMPLTDILQFLSLNKKEGELKVLSGNSTARVFVKGGEVYNASVEGAEREKALFRLLQWSEGTFEFTPKAIDAPRKIHSATSNLLMEGARQIDELKRLSLPGRDSVLGIKAPLEPQGPGAEPIIHEIMRVIKVYPRTHDLVDHCGYPDYEVYWALSNMISRGLIEEVKASGAESSAGFFTIEESINIREKIINRFSAMPALNYAKIFLISSSGALSEHFLNLCASTEGVTLGKRSFFSETSSAGLFGEAASLSLHGGMDLVVFSIPTVKGMGPLMEAFSTNLIGIIFLWEAAAEGADELAQAKKALEHTKVPAVHIFNGGKKAILRASFKKPAALKEDEPVFIIGEDENIVFDAFHALTGKLLETDYTAR